MLFSAAAPLISLSFFSSFAVVQSAPNGPNCSTAFGTTWDWSYNSLGQNPCTVATYMISTCDGANFSLAPAPAPDPDDHYTGPGASDGSKLCLCSTVTFSLLSACGICQGAGLINWSQYAYNCTTTMPPGSFPDPIPAGTRLPQWALLDVTSENHWNASKSQAVGDTPELGPGTIPSGPSGPASTGPTNAYPITTPASSSSSYSSSNSATPMPISGQSSNTGAIAGGVAGGLAAISIVVAALLFYRRRRNPPAPSAPSSGDRQRGGFESFDPFMDRVSQPSSGQGIVSPSLPETTTSMLRSYNADDSATYPTYQGTSPPPTYNPFQSPSNHQ